MREESSSSSRVCTKPYNGSIDQQAVSEAIRELENRFRDECLVYVIATSNRAFVKIGVTQDCETLGKRLRALQASTPIPLELLTLFAGCQVLEHALHRCFKADRVNGEWFHFSATIHEFVKQSERLNYYQPNHGVIPANPNLLRPIINRGKGAGRKANPNKEERRRLQKQEVCAHIAKHGECVKCGLSELLFGWEWRNGYYIPLPLTPPNPAQ